MAVATPDARCQRLARAREDLARAALDAEERLASAEALGRVGQLLMAQVQETLALLSSAAVAKQLEMRAALGEFGEEVAAELDATRTALDLVEAAAAESVADDFAVEEALAEAEATVVAASSQRRTLRLSVDNEDSLLGLARALDKIQLAPVPATAAEETAGMADAAAERDSIKVESDNPRRQPAGIRQQRRTNRKRINNKLLMLLLLLLSALGCAMLTLLEPAQLGLLTLSGPVFAT